MPLIFFAEKSAPPDENALHAALGDRASQAWRTLIERVRRRCQPINEQWGFTSKTTGWGLRLKHGERIVMYMTPRSGSFLVSFALGEKAVSAAEGADIPESVREVIRRARRYAEGRAVRFEVHGPNDLAALDVLAVIKISS